MFRSVKAGISAGVLAVVLAGAAGHGASAAERWITHPTAVAADAQHKPIALQFRRELTLAQAPGRQFVHVSADNRFVLYVNGRRVAAGPARGDLAHWRYERLDLAPYLKRGANVIAAEVWNDGGFAPMAQISARTAFLLESEGGGAALDTGQAWRVRVDPSRTVESGMAQLIRAVGETYYVAGAPETHDGAARAWDWAAHASTAGDWSAAVDAVEPSGPSPWTLVADRLPPMSYEPAKGGAVVRSQGAPASRFPDGPVTVPAGSEAVFLVDAGAVAAAYPVLTTSGGRGAEVKVVYTEALYGPDKKRLANRAQVAGGQALGLADTFRPDGGANRAFESFWWRAWRFAEIRVKTGAEPLTLVSFQRRLTGYPFTTDAHFTSSDPELDRIWRIGWDTVRLDAHETYMDTAYWEQLQYVGDTRLSVLVSYAVSRDGRLPLQAIEAIEQSNPGGLPRSRSPSRQPQTIPPFALLWIGMLHDHWMRQPDTAVLQASLSTMRRTLDWYAGHLDAQGLVAPTDGWDFIDWEPGLSNYPAAGKHPDDRCVIALMYRGALKQAADLERALGDPGRAQADAGQADRVGEAVRAHCWSAERGLFANDPDKQAFSQHANALAVLYDVAPRAEQAAILDRITVRGQGIDPPAGVTGMTYYFSFYLVRALEHAGLADRYGEILKTWRGLLHQNFTTWPETPDPSRSDSHAWSAHPTVDLLAIVAGVEPAAPGFAAVRVAPHLGALTALDAATAHPNGLVETRYRRRGRMLGAAITLPAGISGRFEWGGRSAPLHPGLNRLRLAAEGS